MTIRDMLEQGVIIQGSVCVKLWSEEHERQTVLLKSDDFECLNMKHGFLDMQLNYIYCENGELIIEVTDERGI